MILTGNAMIHRFYLDNDSSQRNGRFHYRKKNCEDISMNVMIGKYLADSGHPQPVGICMASGAKGIGNFSMQ